MGHDSSNKQKLSIDSEMVYTVSCGLIQITDISFTRNLEGSSETPLHFIFRYKGDSVGRYRRYPCDRQQLQGALVFALTEIWIVCINCSIYLMELVIIQVFCKSDFCRIFLEANISFASKVQPQFQTEGSRLLS